MPRRRHRRPRWDRQTVERFVLTIVLAAVCLLIAWGWMQLWEM